MSRNARTNFGGLVKAFDSDERGCAVHQLANQLDNFRPFGHGSKIGVVLLHAPQIADVLSVSFKRAVAFGYFGDDLFDIIVDCRFSFLVFFRGKKIFDADTTITLIIGD